MLVYEHAEGMPLVGNPAASAKEQLESVAGQSEKALVAGDFLVAAKQAEALLNKTVYISGSDNLQTRVGYVLLQARYELDRLEEAFSFLLQHHGKLQNLQPQVLFLWASLAIDSDASQLAAQTLHSYLQTAVVTSKGTSQHDSGHPPDAIGHITSEVYMMAARMYAIEVLTKALDSSQEAEIWIHGAHYLKADQKQELLSELQTLQPDHPSSSQSDTSDSSQELPAPQHSMAARTPASAQQAQQPYQHSNTMQEVEHRLGQSEVNEEQAAEIQPAQDSDSLQLPGLKTNSKTGWFAQSPEWGAALYNMCNSNQPVRIGGSDYSLAQVGGTAVLAALLSCAAIAERQWIKRAAKRSGSWLQKSLVDVTSAAFSFNINPMTAVRGPLHQ